MSLWAVAACGAGGAAAGPLLNVVVGRARPAHPARGRRALVPVSSAALFALAGRRFGWSPALPAMLAFIAGLVALACCDLEHRVLPKRIVLATGAAVGAGLVGAAAGSGEWGRLWVAGACAEGGFAVFYALWRASPRSLGYGDVRLAALVGGGLGWLGVRYALAGLFFASAAGAAVGLGLIAARRGSLKTALPYGTFLAGGAIAAALLRRY